MRIMFEVRLIDWNGFGSWRRMSRFDTYEEAERFIMERPDPNHGDQMYQIEKIYVVEKNKQKYCGAI